MVNTENLIRNLIHEQLGISTFYKACESYENTPTFSKNRHNVRPTNILPYWNTCLREYLIVETLSAQRHTSQDLAQEVSNPQLLPSNFKWTLYRAHLELWTFDWILWDRVRDCWKKSSDIWDSRVQLKFYHIVDCRTAVKVWIWKLWFFALRTLSLQLTKG